MFLDKTTVGFTDWNLSLSLGIFSLWWKIFSQVIVWWQVVIWWQIIVSNFSDNFLNNWFLGGNNNFFNFNFWIIKFSFWFVVVIARLIFEPSVTTDGNMWDITWGSNNKCKCNNDEFLWIDKESIKILCHYDN